MSHETPGGRRTDGQEHRAARLEPMPDLAQIPLGTGRRTGEHQLESVDRCRDPLRPGPRPTHDVDRDDAFEWHTHLGDRLDTDHRDADDRQPRPRRHRTRRQTDRQRHRRRAATNRRRDRGAARRRAGTARTRHRPAGIDRAPERSASERRRGAPDQLTEHTFDQQWGDTDVQRRYAAESPISASVDTMLRASAA